MGILSGKFVIVLGAVALTSFLAGILSSKPPQNIYIATGTVTDSSSWEETHPQMMESMRSQRAAIWGK